MTQSNIGLLFASGTVKEEDGFIRVTVFVFCKCLSVSVCLLFPFGFEGDMWDLIVSSLRYESHNKEQSIAN